VKIIDSQVHILDRDHPGRPWDSNLGSALGSGIAAALKYSSTGAAITTDARMLRAMDQVGVDAALLVSTSHYGWDNSYSLEAAQKAPNRFAVIGRIDAACPDVEERVAIWESNPVAVGLRIFILSDVHRDQFMGGHFDRLLRAAQNQSIPMTVYPPGYLSTIAIAAERFPKLQWVVDHVGIAQPPVLMPDVPRFKRLPELLALARFPNVVVKLSAVPALSAERFPFSDLWPFIHSIVDAYGIERVMWGSDWTRVATLLSYEEGLRYVRDSSELSLDEKTQLLGGTLSRVFGWHP